jgi:hypothetical protein
MSIVDGCVLRLCSGAEVRSGSLADGTDRPARGSLARGCAWVSFGGSGRCTCRECHPGSLGGGFVFAEYATEAVTPMDG